MHGSNLQQTRAGNVARCQYLSTRAKEESQGPGLLRQLQDLRSPRMEGRTGLYSRIPGNIEITRWSSTLHGMGKSGRA